MVQLRALLSTLFSILNFVFIVDQTALCNPINTITAADKTIAPRSFLATTGLVLRASTTFEVIVPSHLAAYCLKELYSGILASAIHQMILKQPDSPSVTFTRGPFALTFVADALDHSIPWNVIGQFCSDMVDWTNRGFLATYERGYWDLEGTFGVFVSLRFSKEVPFN